MAENFNIMALENTEKAPDSPFTLFDEWILAATESEPVDPEAMALATTDPDGRPSVRMVLLKAWDERGFVFYTNLESRKGQALAAHPVAATCFHWKSLARQIRVEGTVEQVSNEEADAYFETRSYGSRLGANASRQSRPLRNRTQLATEIAAVEHWLESFPVKLTRPEYWSGYRIKPDAIEFWQEGENRLHTRLVYRRRNDGWTREMLYP